MAMQAELTMNPVTAGCFCWNELATWDIDAASAFYCDLFGWTAENTECGDKPYTLFKKDGNPVGGMMKMDSNWPEDTPSHWGSYIAVDDVDATASKAEAFGGKLCCGPEDAGEEGRYALITDPTGAAFSIYAGGDGMNAAGYGSFCWNELYTTDMDLASSFYTEFFGWSAVASSVIDEPYTVFKSGEAWACGMMNMHWEGKPSWLGYISVADVDATTAKAIEMGCHSCVEPTDIPSVGRFAVFTDPFGATIGVFSGQSEFADGSCWCS